jgi:hypothetical protein
MANYRIEIVRDEATKLYRADLYYPSTEATPIASTSALYQSPEEAEERIRQLLDGLSKRDLDPEISN